MGFLVVHPEWSVSFIMQDAKYLASSELFAFHRPSGVLHSHESVGRPGSLRLPPDLLDSTARFCRKGYELTFAFGGVDGPHRLGFAMGASSHGPAVTGELELDVASASAPLSVSSRLPKGSLYTYKSVFPVSGAMQVGDDEIRFDPTRDLAIIDEHRSLLPYRTDWTWGTFAFGAQDGIVGANFASRPHREGQEEESGLWFPGVCEALADITFTPSSDDPSAPWEVTSADGRLEVTFTPARRNTVEHQFGIFAVDYFMMYGAYDGVLRGSQRSYDVRNVHGVLEQMHARL